MSEIIKFKPVIVNNEMWVGSCAQKGEAQGTVKDGRLLEHRQKFECESMRPKGRKFVFATAHFTRWRLKVHDERPFNALAVECVNLDWLSDDYVSLEVVIGFSDDDWVADDPFNFDYEVCVQIHLADNG